MAPDLAPTPTAAAPRPLRVALVAGEDSGDLLGADLARALAARVPGVEIAGMAGPRMSAAGVSPWWPASELAVMGLVEVLRHLPRLLRLRRALIERVTAWRPDVYVGIDAPDFNLGVERRLRSRGIRTVHYVSPSIWAWRESRVRTIGACADRVLCLFPIEPPIYARHRVDARFVGHPLADAFPPEPDRAAARAALGLPPAAPVLAVLPGSRVGEVARLGAIFADAVERLRRTHPGLVAIAPMANARCRDVFAPVAERIRLLDGRSHEAMVAADVVLLASGTAALEAMLAKRPMVVGYRIAPVTHFIVRRLGLLKIDRYSLPNVLAGEPLVPELMQHDCTPERLAEAVARLLDDPGASARMLTRFHELHESLRRGASERAAEAILELAGPR
jgi:lipid-A-disaccharide synthase